MLEISSSQLIIKSKQLPKLAQCLDDDLAEKQHVNDLPYTQPQWSVQFEQNRDHEEV